MNYFVDDMNCRYLCAGEVDFGDVIVQWHDYCFNLPIIKRLGGKYATVILDSKTGKFLIKRHYRNDYMRSHCLSKLIDEAKKLIP